MMNLHTIEWDYTDRLNDIFFSYTTGTATAVMQSDGLLLTGGDSEWNSAHLCIDQSLLEGKKRTEVEITYANATSPYDNSEVRFYCPSLYTNGMLYFQNSGGRVCIRNNNKTVIAINDRFGRFNTNGIVKIVYDSDTKLTELYANGILKYSYTEPKNVMPTVNSIVSARYWQQWKQKGECTCETCENYMGLKKERKSSQT